MFSADVTGRLQAAPAQGTLPSGAAVANFTLIDVTETAGPGDSTVTERQYISVSVYDDGDSGLASRVLGMGLQAGDTLLASGRMAVREYVRKDGTAGAAVQLAADIVQVEQILPRHAHQTYAPGETAPRTQAAPVAAAPAPVARTADEVPF